MFNLFKYFTKNKSGFTLVELMTASAILLIVLAAVGTVFLSTYSTFFIENDKMAAIDYARQAMEIVMDDLRKYGGSDTYININGFDGTNAVFYLPSGSIAYKYDSTNKMITKKIGSGSDDAILTGISITAFTATETILSTNNQVISLSISVAAGNYGTQTVTSTYRIKSYYDTVNIQSGQMYRLKAKYSSDQRGTGIYAEVISPGISNNEPIQQRAWNGGNNQKWYIDTFGDGTYKFTSVNSGKVMDVSGASNVNETQIIQHTLSGNNNQRWMIVDAGSGYVRLVAKHSGKVMDVKNWLTSDGADIQQFEWRNTDNQKWLIELAP